MKLLKIGVYRRVSTDDQVNVFEGSLQSQKYRIDEFVKFKNSQSREPWGKVIDYYDEEGVSAGTTNRPEYQRLMSDIRSRRINMILVSDLTRLSRNLLDFCNLINELEEYNASYLSMKEQFDTSTPIGRMIVYIIIALGQFERETTSERVSINHHTRAIKGLFNGGPAPLGYDKHAEKKGLLVVNEQEAEVVRQIFEIFLEEGSRAKTIKRLQELRIQPKRTTKRAHAKGYLDWTVQNLGTLLSNVSYVGVREVNKTYKDESEDNLKPWQRYQTVKASWTPILTDKIFQDAQLLLQEAATRERTRMGKRERRYFLLTGILTCGETGLPLVGQAGHSSCGTVHRYYHYVRKPKGLKEVRKRLNADELEEKILSEFKLALRTKGYFEELSATLKEFAEANGNQSKKEYKRLSKQLADINSHISGLWASQGRMKLNEEALRLASEELNRLAKEKTALEKQLERFDPAKFETATPQKQALFIENQIRTFLQGWPKASNAVRKRLIRRVIKSVIVTHDEICLTLWTSAEERSLSIGDEAQGESDLNSNVVNLPRHSPPVTHQNDAIKSSGKVGNGRGYRT